MIPFENDIYHIINKPKLPTLLHDNSKFKSNAVPS